MLTAPNHRQIPLTWKSAEGGLNAPIMHPHHLRSRSTSPPPPVPPKDEAAMMPRYNEALGKAKRNIDRLLDQGMRHFVGPQGDDGNAMEVWKEALDESLKWKDSFRRARALNNICCVHRRRVEIGLGLKVLDEAWDVGLTILEDMLGDDADDVADDDGHEYVHMSSEDLEDDRNRKDSLKRAVSLIKGACSKRFEDGRGGPTSSSKAMKLLGIQKAPSLSNEKAARILGLEGAKERPPSTDKLLKVLGLSDSADFVAREQLQRRGTTSSKSMTALPITIKYREAEDIHTIKRSESVRIFNTPKPRDLDSSLQNLVFPTRKSLTTTFGPPILVLLMDMATSFGNLYFAAGKISTSIVWHQGCLELVKLALTKYPLPSMLSDLDDLRNNRPACRWQLSYIHRHGLMAKARSLSHIGVCMRRLGDVHRALMYQRRALNCMEVFQIESYGKAKADEKSQVPEPNIAMERSRSTGSKSIADSVSIHSTTTANSILVEPVLERPIPSIHSKSQEKKGDNDNGSKLLNRNASSTSSTPSTISPPRWFRNRALPMRELFCLVHLSVRGNLSTTLFALGQVSAAGKGLEECVQGFTDLDDMYGKTTCLINWASCVAEIGRIASCGEVLRDMLEEAKGSERKTNWLHNTSAALKLLLESLENSNYCQYVDAALTAKFNIAAILIVLERPDAAINILRSLATYLDATVTQPIDTWTGADPQTIVFNFSQCLFLVAQRPSSIAEKDRDWLETMLTHHLDAMAGRPLSLERKEGEDLRQIDTVVEALRTVLDRTSGSIHINQPKLILPYVEEIDISGSPSISQLPTPMPMPSLNHNGHGANGFTTSSSSAITLPPTNLFTTTPRSSSLFPAPYTQHPTEIHRIVRSHSRSISLDLIPPTPANPPVVPPKRSSSPPPPSTSNSQSHPPPLPPLPPSPKLLPALTNHKIRVTQSPTTLHRSNTSVSNLSSQSSLSSTSSGASIGKGRTPSLPTGIASRVCGGLARAMNFIDKEGGGRKGKEAMEAKRWVGVSGMSEKNRSPGPPRHNSHPSTLQNLISSLYTSTNNLAPPSVQNSYSHDPKTHHPAQQSVQMWDESLALVAIEIGSIALSLIHQDEKVDDAKARMTNMAKSSMTSLVSLASLASSASSGSATSLGFAGDLVGLEDGLMVILSRVDKEVLEVIRELIL
ncbi:hypothetical protein HDU97_003188 [Phlyctochytrium planicorne]|nr:hypothetical protein HDU97_003188 [Phlyctochytrium planicorne]